MSVDIRRWEEFGSQQLASPPSPLRPDLVVVRNKAKDEASRNERRYDPRDDMYGDTFTTTCLTVYHTLNCEAFSINYADICIRWGLYESALRYVGWPIIPGFDIAGQSMKSVLQLQTWGTNGTIRMWCFFFPCFPGEVEMAGAESGFSVGDRVFGCSFFGAYASRSSAEHVQIVQPNTCFRKQWYNYNNQLQAQRCMIQWCFTYICRIFWDVPGTIHHTGSNHRSLSRCSSGVVVPSWQVMKMPDEMAFESAAALPTVVLTALHAVNLAPTSIFSAYFYRFSIQVLILLIFSTFHKDVSSTVQMQNMFQHVSSLNPLESESEMWIHKGRRAWASRPRSVKHSLKSFTVNLPQRL